MKTVTIYTDGACSGNPGPGGWGAILQYGEFRKELSGGEAHTTNNRMELTGVITALEALKEPCIVELYSDSKYVIDALQKGWAKGWRARGWIKADKKPGFFARVGKWFKELKSELKKVQWPTRKQTINNTLIVIACVVIVGIFIWIFDFLAGTAIDLIITTLS